MKQYIDKSAVIAEIEKLQDSTMDDNSNFCTAEAQAEYDVLCVLEEYLDTLEVKEETISNEPLISSELLTASADYAREQLANPDYPTYNDEYELLCAFEAGANWQKEPACTNDKCSQKDTCLRWQLGTNNDTYQTYLDGSMCEGEFYVESKDK